MEKLVKVLTISKSEAVGKPRRGRRLRDRFKHPMTPEQREASVQIGQLTRMKQTWWRHAMAGEMVIQR